MKRKKMMLLAVSLIAIAGCGKENLQSAPLPECAYLYYLE